MMMIRAAAAVMVATVAMAMVQFGSMTTMMVLATVMVVS